MNQPTTSFVQVPVINKTDSIFKRKEDQPDQVVDQISDQVSELLAKEKPIVTVKVDGTCGIICKTEGSDFFVMRRQDIKVCDKDGTSSKKYKSVMSSTLKTVFAGQECMLSAIDRQNGKTTKSCPLYIFQLDKEGYPEIENGHIIGFTPVDRELADDKYLMTAFQDSGILTSVFDGNLDVVVKPVPISDLMGQRNIMTVEFMGSKIAQRYGFQPNDPHFICPHGQIVFPPDQVPPFQSYHELKAWFENENNNRWADVEGIVVHFPSNNIRFKVHRGHLGLNTRWGQKQKSLHSWDDKKKSGIVFRFQF
ncbi:MAG: hypothetical protein Satyrvirus27_8 [Satyrvirus sp.]|uniref:Uncharacterized protein n=1 Tax=Satyrvirus sp. TaxID=2487771 RepID=A0A3G5AH55_9VIRU|nr:MAG: hypothetical protein Satyrvirus27_8 [Satyrvirus sp.]